MAPSKLRNTSYLHFSGVLLILLEDFLERQRVSYGGFSDTRRGWLDHYPRNARVSGSHRSGALYQGLTLVGPFWPNKDLGFSP